MSILQVDWDAEIEAALTSILGQTELIVLSRLLRFAVVQNVYLQGILTEEEAKECLCRELEPDNPDTFYDDSGLLGITCAGEARKRIEESMGDERTDRPAV